MHLNKNHLLAILLCSSLFYTSCKIPVLVQSPNAMAAPAAFGTSTDSTSSAALQYRQFFKDKYLVALIDTALLNNQEMNIALQEIEMTRNDIQARQGDILPQVEAGGGIGIEKAARYTSQGAGDASTDITEGKEVPEWLPDYKGGVFASWEVDIWKKLRTAKQAAIQRYLASVEGRKFITTNLIAEIANAYYELLALDNQLDFVQQNIKLQQNALDIVRLQKQAAAANELAVKKFEAEVLGSQSLEFGILQKIKATENELNYLLGRYPQPIERDRSGILNLMPSAVSAGIPSQLLNNRPDIKQAELELSAAKLDVNVARAEFYPHLDITAGLGLQAFNPKYLIKFPESLLFNLAGDIAGPIINRNAITAEYNNANARQIQAVYNYDRTVLNAYVEVATELSNIDNLQQQYSLQTKQVETLTAAIDISTDLFKSARADYLEVLLTQRDALETKLELIETKLQQFNASTNVYRALGGGGQ
ncbi:MAG: efflux transporter outer membrane subunit [Bacteroidetes bacterium]|nr:efflux transporter outer membrane subunit [Bacteroidota bacterium]